MCISKLLSAYFVKTRAIEESRLPSITYICARELVTPQRPDLVVKMLYIRYFFKRKARMPWLQDCIRRIFVR